MELMERVEKLGRRLSPRGAGACPIGPGVSGCDPFVLSLSIKVYLWKLLRAFLIDKYIYI